MTTAASQLEALRRPRARSTGFWGMILLITTEASLFAYLLFSYFYLASMAGGRWPPEGPPKLRLVIPNTVILLLSSATMYWAEAGVRRGRPGRLRIGLSLTLLLGVVFLIIQGIEYGNKHITPTSHAYGSLFFTITGFHGAHVLAGLLMIAVVTVRALLDHFSSTSHDAVTNVAWYWHFVDLVWLSVFTCLYLSPYLA